MSILLQTGGYTLLQTAVAVAVLVALLAGAAAIGLTRRFRGLERDAREQIKTVRGTQLTTSPVTKRFDAAAVRDGAANLEDAIRELVAAAEDGASGQQQHTLRVALADAWRDVTDDLDRRVLALGRVALLVLVFGPLAVSTQRVVTLLRTDPGGPGLQTVLDGVLSGTTTAVDVLASVATAFPFAGTVWALALAGGIRLAELLYTLWWLVALWLGLAAIGLYVLDDRAEPMPSVAGRRWRVARVLGVLVAVWLVGTIPATLGRAVGLDTVGAVLGALAAGVVTLWLAFLGARGWVRRLRRAQWDPTGATVEDIAYRLTRTASVWLLVVGTPLALAYAAVAVVGGGLVAVGQALLSAHPLVQTGVLLAALAAAAVVALLLRDHWSDIRGALRNTTVRARVRGAVWTSGMPLFVGVLLYAGLTAVTALPVAAVAAIGLTVALHGLGRKAKKVQYGASLGPDGPRQHDPLVEIWVVDDADARTQYLARVSGTGIAHTDRAAFVDAVAAAARDMARDGQVDPSIATLYHDRLTRQGMTRIEQFDVDEYVRVQIFQALYGPDGRKRTVRREWFEDELSDLPSEVVDRQLAAHRECLYATDEIVELRRDPYRSETAERDGPVRPTV